jgi:hypothetical protein
VAHLDFLSQQVWPFLHDEGDVPQRDVLNLRLSALRQCNERRRQLAAKPIQCFVVRDDVKVTATDKHTNRITEQQEEITAGSLTGG